MNAHIIKLFLLTDASKDRYRLFIKHRLLEFCTNTIYFFYQIRIVCAHVGI